jgi:hypothetical protein
MKITKAQEKKAQEGLCSAIAWWAGVEHKLGYSDVDSYQRFNDQFGISVRAAQSLGPREAVELALKIQAELAKVAVTPNWEGQWGPTAARGAL